MFTIDIVSMHSVEYGFSLPVDCDAHEAEEGDCRGGVEQHGKDLAREAILGAQYPVPET